METTEARKAPPRDNLVRGVFPGGIELREADDAAPKLFGHFAVFDVSSEINSAYEGNFMESIAPGAFAKTIKEGRSGMRALFQHGRDPQIGDKPLGPITDLREDEFGAYYEVEMMDTSYNRDLLPGLKAGVYGASFRFQVMREDWVEEPEPSGSNPRGIPERRIREARVLEMGPVTWGQYPEATAGVRSLTDEWRAANVAPPLREDATGAPKLASEAAEDSNVTFTAALDPERTVNADNNTTDTATTAAPSHPADEPRRDTQPATNHEAQEDGMNSIEEMRARLADIRSELEDIANENGVAVLDGPSRTRWDALVEEREQIAKAVKDTEERQDYLRTLAENPDNIDEGTTRTNGGIGIPASRDTGTYVTRTAGRNDLPDNIFDTTEYIGRAKSREHMGEMFRDGARRAIETFSYAAAPHLERSTINEHIEGLIAQSPEHAQHILTYGGPAYRNAFWKHTLGKPMSREEQAALAAGEVFQAQRALSTTDTGGVTVPVQIDPTVLPSSNGSLNPWRQIAKVVTTTSHQWQAVTAADVTATYRAEGATMSDNSPTLVAPAITPERADVFIPFSWEAAADWTRLETDLGMLIQRAKDNAEAAKFAVGAGSGSDEPQGVLIGAGTLVGTNATVSIGTSDIFTLFNSLGPSFQGNATWVAHQSVLSRFRQLVSATGPGMWAESLVAGNPATLLGRPVYAASSVGTAGAVLPPVASVKYAIVGDFSYFAIVDRVGLQMKYIDNIFAGNTAGAISYPTGRSGIVAYWRNSSGVLASNAFRTGTVT